MVPSIIPGILDAALGESLTLSGVEMRAARKEGAGATHACPVEQRRMGHISKKDGRQCETEVNGGVHADVRDVSKKGFEDNN